MEELFTERTWYNQRGEVVEEIQTYQDSAESYAIVHYSADLRLLCVDLSAFDHRGPGDGGKGNAVRERYLETVHPKPDALRRALELATEWKKKTAAWLVR